MLVAGGGQRAGAARLLRRRRPTRARRRHARPSCCAIDVSFGDAAQVFHIGPASCGVYGAPAGVCEAVAALGHDAARASSRRPPRELAREGVVLNAGQAYVAEILADLLTSTPECAALWAPHGHVLREGEVLRNPELGDALERLGARGRRAVLPRRHRRRGRATGCGARGGSLTREDLAGYDAIEREPVRVRYRDREVLTNPPPSAGGTLLAYALALLDRGPAPPTLRGVVAAMAAAQSERTPEFVEGLDEEGFLERFLASAARLDDAHLGARRATAAPAARPAPTARARAWSCRARACTSTT